MGGKDVVLCKQKSFLSVQLTNMPKPWWTGTTVGIVVRLVFCTQINKSIHMDFIWWCMKSAPKLKDVVGHALPASTQIICVGHFKNHTLYTTLMPYPKRPAIWRKNKVLKQTHRENARIKPVTRQPKETILDILWTSSLSEAAMEIPAPAFPPAFNMMDS